MHSHKSQDYVPAFGFRWLTPAYDLVVAITTRETTFKRTLVEQLAAQTGQRILELGCGTGTLLVKIAERCPGAGVVRVDRDPDILRLAARKAAKLPVPIRLDRALASGFPTRTKPSTAWSQA